MVEQILFYEPDEPHGFLSNFCCAPITVFEQSWSTSEHYYQAQKFSDIAIQRQIRHAPTPDEAFSLSRKYAHLVRCDWDEIKLSVMAFVVREKFLQNPKLANQLIKTGDANLTEHSHKDEFWGDGGDGKGQNQLGIILMQVREELKMTEPDDLFELYREHKHSYHQRTSASHGGDKK
jgi:GTP cyclohydrolase II